MLRGNAFLLQLVSQIVADTEPVAVHGLAGTIVLWHRACLHSVGANYSNTLRQAVLYDFPAASSAPLTTSSNTDEQQAVDDEMWSNATLDKGGDGGRTQLFCFRASVQPSRC